MRKNNASTLHRVAELPIAIGSDIGNVPFAVLSENCLVF